MERLISPEQLAALLGDIPVRTLYRWRQTNYGPTAIRVGKHLRYRTADVTRWIDEQAAQEGAAA